MQRHPRPRRLTALALAALCGACTDDPTGGTVTSGTITGVPFTVSSGQVTQAFPDGPILADGAGAEILLTQSPAALGMSNPRHLHLRTLFALREGGAITIGAFGTAGAPFGTGNAVEVERTGPSIDYAFYVDSAVFADSSFVPPPSVSSEEQWLVTEFYADSVPGYGAGSGMTIWPLNDLAPALGADVLGCTQGPAMTDPMTGNQVAYRLTSAFLVAIAVLDTIIGPCV